MHPKRPILISFAFFFLAVVLLSYPWISLLLGEKYRSDVETAYYSTMENTGQQELKEMFQQAIVYNQMLCSSIYEGEALASPLPYKDILNTNGIMGYVDIPKISVYLPICHGTDAETLEQAVGHVMGTSLPVGGAGTHAVLSAHSGMSVNRLFSDIDKLTEGDVFLIHVLDETLAYEVDQIAVVEPTDTSKLQIENGKDYVTLVTCTPFGVNTHRLLVRGHRTDVPEVKLLAVDAEVSAPASSTWMQHYLKGLGCSVGSLALLIGGYFIFRRRRKS